MLSIFFRHKREGVNSIESVFGAIDSMLAPHRNHTLPESGGRPFAILKNIIYAWTHRGKINHVTGDAHYIVIGTGRKTLLTIHDVGSALTGSWLKRQYVRFLWFILPILIAKKVSVISESTKQAVLQIAPWATSKLNIVPNPYNQVFRGTIVDNVKTPTSILHIGTKANKNLERTIEAIKDIDCCLTVIGKMTAAQIKLAESTGIRYTNKYDISIDALVDEYKKCDIVSFPSTFEGFGMPVIEAQAMCRPILVGDIPVLRDVAGNDGALFVNPYDVDAIKNGFKRLISDNILRQTLITNGQRNISRFESELIAERYNQIYKEI